MKTKLQDVRNIIEKIYDLKIFLEDFEENFDDPELVLDHQKEYTDVAISTAYMQMGYREHLKSLMEMVKDFEYKYIFK